MAISTILSSCTLPQTRWRVLLYRMYSTSRATVPVSGVRGLSDNYCQPSPKRPTVHCATTVPSHLLRRNISSLAPKKITDGEEMNQKATTRDHVGGNQVTPAFRNDDIGGNDRNNNTNNHIPNATRSRILAHCCSSFFLCCSSIFFLCCSSSFLFSSSSIGWC